MEKRYLRTNKKAQDMQDEIFRKMSAEKKIKISAELADFCLKLNNLNGNIRPGKTSYKSS